MKRIIIIFIIAFCLLSFVGLSYLAKEPSSPGKAWNTSSDVVKNTFVVGLGAGITHCLDKLMPLVTVGSSETILLEIFLDRSIDFYSFIYEHRENLIAVMDDLYKDPANTYILPGPLCEIAYQKLKGEDIEPLLKEARKEAIPQNK